MLTFKNWLLLKKARSMLNEAYNISRDETGITMEEVLDNIKAQAPACVTCAHWSRCLRHEYLTYDTPCYTQDIHAFFRYIKRQAQPEYMRSTVLIDELDETDDTLPVEEKHVIARIAKFISSINIPK